MGWTSTIIKHLNGVLGRHKAKDIDYDSSGNAGILIGETNVQDALDTIDDNAVTRAEWYQNGFLDVDGGVPDNDILITFDNTSRTLSLAPTGTDFTYYRMGQKFIESATLTKQILDEDGLWVFYIGSAGLSITKNPSHDQVDEAIEKTAIVAYVMWDATNNLGKLMWEAHGMNMSPETHHWLHDNIGAVYREGMTLSGMTVDTGGDLDSDVQFDVSAGIFYDEDIQNGVSAIATGDNYDVWYLDGSNWRWTNTDVPGIPISAGNRAAFNDAGSQTEVDNNDFVLAHIFATNIMTNAGSTTREYIFIQGQFEYNTKRAARAGADVEINNLVYGTLPLQEVIPVATIILQAQSGNDNSIKCKVVSTESGDDFVDWRGSDLKATGGSIADHGALAGLSDDDHPQYLRADGTRSLAGAWDMGSQALTNVNIDTGDIATAVTNSEWDAAYTHITATGASHSYINQAVLTNSVVTFSRLVIDSGSSNGLGFSDPNFCGISLATNKAAVNYRDDNKLSLNYNSDFTNGIYMGGSTEIETNLFVNGKIGIGITPSYALDIYKTAESGVAEVLFNATISDSSTGYFRVSNSTSAAGRFIPQLLGKADTLGGVNIGLRIIGELDPTDDVAGSYGVYIQSQLDTGAVLTNANVLRVRNYNVDLLTISAAGKIGIGTSTPSGYVEIERTIDNSASNPYTSTPFLLLDNHADVNGLNVPIVLHAGSGENAIISAYRPSNGNMHLLFGFRTTNTGGAWAEVMRITDTGYVGIGTTTPGNKLDIVTGSTTSSAMHIGENLNEGAYFTSISDSQLSIAAGGEYVSAVWKARSTKATLINQAGGNIYFYTNTGLTDGSSYTPTQRMRLHDTGQLEIIGTSLITPLLLTNTSGSCYIQTRGSTSGNCGINFGDSGSDSVGRILYYHAQNRMRFYTNSGERMNISSVGYVGINDTAPAALLTLKAIGDGSAAGGIRIIDNGTTNVPVFIYQNLSAGVLLLRNSAGSSVVNLNTTSTITLKRVYDNTTASAANVNVDSSGLIKRVSSSVKYKNNIEDMGIEYADNIYKMRPIYYKSICDGDNQDWSHWGLSAEELKDIDPRLVHFGYKEEDMEIVTIPAVMGMQQRLLPKENEDDEDQFEDVEVEIEPEEKKQVPKEGAPLEPEGVQYERLAVLLIKTAQEQKKIIDDLLERVKILEN